MDEVKKTPSADYLWKNTFFQLKLGSLDYTPNVDYSSGNMVHKLGHSILQLYILFGDLLK